MGPKKNKKKKASEEEVKEEVKVEEVEMEYDDAPGDDVRYIRPEDQLDLTEEELEQEVQRTLQAKVGGSLKDHPWRAASGRRTNSTALYVLL